MSQGHAPLGTQKQKFRELLADWAQGAGEQLDQDVEHEQPAALAAGWSYPTQGWESTQKQQG